MDYAILFFGVLIAFGSMILLIRPIIILNFFAKYGESISLHVFAVAVRLVAGAALIIGASGSRYPLVLLVLGWLFIIAALVLGVIGRARFKRIIKWARELAPRARYPAGVTGLLLGGFLIHAVL